MELLASYKLRLDQLINGAPEVYEGELETINQIIKGDIND